MWPTYEQIAFGEKRKQMDLLVLERLSVKSHLIDISDNRWDVALENIVLNITNSDNSPLC